MIGGLSIGALFVTDIQLGLVAWGAAALHEIPQELGDFGILIQGGWTPKKALAFNWISGLTFLVGALGAYLVSFEMDVDFLMPFAAGNFLYIGAVDLVPVFKQRDSERPAFVNTIWWGIGMAVLLATHLL